MSGRPQRIIKHVLLNDVGPLSAAQLLAMSEAEWGLLRQIITDRHRGHPHEDIARCMMCGSPVYIRARVFRDCRLPHFAHFSGGDEMCPWFSGRTITPDAARASQYHGQQESAAHRLLCEQIAMLAIQDKRTVSAHVSQYLAPNENDYGRYPDVLLERDYGTRIAIEIQLSNTFQTEISERCRHYEREGVPLLWILYGVEFHDGNIVQSFRDVILRHRGNAFTLDKEAVTASLAQRTLVLKCYLRNNETSYDTGRLVTLDHLTFPQSGIPYVEDRLTPHLLARGDEARRPWKTALQGRSPGRADDDLNQPAFLIANDYLCSLVPELKEWQAQSYQGRWLFANLIAVMFSTLSYAAGNFRNYGSRQPNIQALLNSKLPSENLLPFALVMQAVLTNTAANELLAGSVGVHLQRALAAGNGNFIGDGDPPWTAMRVLVPEVFDPLLRLELETLDTLPVWAVPRSPPIGACI